jgi:hypothetical protein
MPRPTDKTQLLKAIEVEYAKLETELNRLSDDQKQAVSTPTTWSVKDIIAHLHEWSSMVQSWYEAGLRDEVPPLPAPGFKWNQIPALNEQIYFKYRDLSWDEVMALFINSRDKIWHTIQFVSNTEMFTPGYYKWTGKNTMGTYFTSATSSHYVWARKEIRKWIKNQVNLA